jgi:hypothetical protein
VPWETFFTYGESTVYGEGSLGKLRQANEAACCVPKSIDESLAAIDAAAGCCAR